MSFVVLQNKYGISEAFINEVQEKIIIPERVSCSLMTFLLFACDKCPESVKTHVSGRVKSNYFCPGVGEGNVEI